MKHVKNVLQRLPTCHLTLLVGAQFVQETWTEKVEEYDIRSVKLIIFIWKLTLAILRVTKTYRSAFR